MEDYLLAHDLGTSGNKAVLFNSQGKLIKSILYPYETDYSGDHQVEQAPGDWWQAVCNCTRELLQGIDPARIAAVSFSGQMMGCVCVDHKGNALANAIIWADQRAGKEEKELSQKIDSDSFFKITGHRLSASYSLAKLMWIKNNRPGIYQKTAKMLNAKDYIIYQLTGQMVTDYSDGSGTNLMDLNTFTWSDQIIKLSGIDRQKLPQLLPSASVVGKVTARAAALTGLLNGTPVVCGGGDGVCAALGAGCIKEGDAYHYLGSSSWISTVARQPVFDARQRVFNWAHLIPGLITPCGTMQSACGSLHWLKSQICHSEILEAEREGVSVYELITRQIEKSVPGANGILFLPYLLGERSPHWNPDAKGAFIGLKMENQRPDLLRSVMEGISFNLNLICRILKSELSITEITLIGGGAKSRLWPQMLADVYGLKIKVPLLLEEATSLGAAVTAGVGCGLLEDFSAIDRFIELRQEYLPNQKNHSFYCQRMPLFEQAYQSLSDLYARL